MYQQHVNGLVNAWVCACLNMTDESMRHGFYAIILNHLWKFLIDMQLL